MLGWSAARSLLKVDILNIMGPSIMAAAAIWGARTTVEGRLLAFSAADAGGDAPHADRAHDADRSTPFPIPSKRISGRRAGSASFTFFPWAGFVFAGALVGLVIDGLRTRRQEIAPTGIRARRRRR